MYSFKTTAEPFARAYINCDSDNLSLKTATGLYSAAREMPLSISKKTGLPMAFWRDMYVGFGFGSGIRVDYDGLTKEAERCPELAKDYLYIRDMMSPHDTGNLLSAAFDPREQNICDSHAIWGGTWVGHAVPQFSDIAKYGTDALREKVEACRLKNPGNDEFYDAELLMLDAIDVLAERFLALSREMLASGSLNERETAKISRLADALEAGTKKPTDDFFTACALYVMVFSFDGIDSPGYFDQYMIGFWRKTEIGRAREALYDIWEFFHDTRTWNLCIGGSDENWNDMSNELTYEILTAAEKFGYQTPNLTMRCHRNTPEKLLRRAAQVIGTGIGMPTLYNDEAVCPALERLGIPPKDSHLYVMNGCNQIDIQGKSHMGLEDGEVNLANAVELVFTNGVSSTSGLKIGLETGDCGDFGTYEEFYDAVLKQLDYLTDAAVSRANQSQKALAEGSPQPMRSLFIEGCLEKGRDYKNSGPVYGHGQILAEGISVAIDSLAAVKKYVFEEKRFSLHELKAALDADYVGYEEIYTLLKNSPLRFGNDIEYVDSIGAELIDHFNRYLTTKKTYRGGYYGGGCSPFNRAASYGRTTGALPNGRKKGEPLFSDSIGALPGCDTHGPTALLKSCLAFDQTLPTSGFILNIKFDKALFNTQKGQDAFLALYHAYFGGKGQQLSVTVVSREELLDAQANPENHRNLIVRVGGYSDYFVNLPRDLQDNVIARTSY
ncbi:MAG: pyruvate formate lyase family protein [Eubacteriales bacterium]